MKKIDILKIMIEKNVLIIPSKPIQNTELQGDFIIFQHSSGSQHVTGRGCRRMGFLLEVCELQGTKGRKGCLLLNI